MRKSQPSDLVMPDKNSNPSIPIRINYELQSVFINLNQFQLTFIHHHHHHNQNLSHNQNHHHRDGHHHHHHHHHHHQHHQSWSIR